MEQNLPSHVTMSDRLEKLAKNLETKDIKPVHFIAPTNSTEEKTTTKRVVPTTQLFSDEKIMVSSIKCSLYVCYPT